jgi:hypothetical protein
MTATPFTKYKRTDNTYSIQFTLTGKPEEAKRRREKKEVQLSHFNAVSLNML